MNPKQDFDKGRRLILRIGKVFSLLILLVVARQVFATDCAVDNMNDWQIGKICASVVDEYNNYIESRCTLSQNDNPAGNYHNECKQAFDQGLGVCTGSTCEGHGESCTWHGTCSDDFDCCGLNTCDTQGTHKCQDWDNGPEN